MDLIAATAIVAGSASLVAGLTGRIMAGFSTQALQRRMRPTRKSEIRASEKDVHRALAHTQRMMKRFRLLLAVAIAYFAVAFISLVIPHSEAHAGEFVSWQRELFGHAARIISIVVGSLAGAIVVFSAAQAYLIVRRDQREVEKRVEEVSRLVAHH
jgi:hypothetical protein